MGLASEIHQAIRSRVLTVCPRVTTRPQPFDKMTPESVLVWAAQLLRKPVNDTHTRLTLVCVIVVRGRLNAELASKPAQYDVMAFVDEIYNVLRDPPALQFGSGIEQTLRGETIDYVGDPSADAGQPAGGVFEYRVVWSEQQKA